MRGLAGTGTLVRLALRRDRVMLPIWIVALAGTAASSAAATIRLYPDIATRTQAANSINNTPALVALYGRAYDPTALGVVKMGGLGTVLVAVLGILVVVRHTRAEEEAGRLELVGATVVGRYAAVTAALIVALGGHLVLGVLTALGLLEAGLPASGSFAFGLTWTGVGIAFAAVAAVTAQLTKSARTATGIAVSVLGLACLLRAVGDTASGGFRWVSWLSPLGWGQQIRPYAGDRWWMLLPLATFTVCCAAGGYALVARRDLGAGLVPGRLGPASAATALRGPLALAWRVHRGTLLAWTAGFTVAGAVFGNIASGVGNLLDSPQAREMIATLGGRQGLTDSFLATEMGMLGLIASAYGIQAALCMRLEETESRLELVLATSVTRIRWAVGHIVFATAGTTILLTAAGLAAGLAHGMSAGDVPTELPRVLAAALLQLPATWVLVGISVAVFGLVPRLAAVSWGALVVFLLLGQLGPLLPLAQWATDLSPFTHLPKIPGGEVRATPIVWLVVVAVSLTVTGLAAFRRRDVG